MKKIYTLLAVLTTAMFSHAQIVISQVYTAGGNSTSTFKNDFIELFNKSDKEVTLQGAYIHYMP
ncbi:lamin tail domain-containing protein [Chishuiella sp.]|uniref:lamin tail domain-containing protein n=1 Tax=Chishuiella sp. TaxID=1969467 RepID=UPI0028B207FD|nr:lamin tail domain-containing protein [Chishuiella sp.]